MSLGSLGKPLGCGAIVSLRHGLSPGAELGSSLTSGREQSESSQESAKQGKHSAKSITAIPARNSQKSSPNTSTKSSPYCRVKLGLKPPKEKRKALLTAGRAVRTASSTISGTTSRTFSDYYTQKADNARNDCLITMNIVPKDETDGMKDSGQSKQHNSRGLLK